MTCSTSSSSRGAVLGAVLLLLVVPGCALLERGGPPALEFQRLAPDHPGPRAVGSLPIRWTASATGGVGALLYEFRTSRGRVEVVQQRGSLSTWDWVPAKAGTFRVKVTIRDAAGASVDSDWSSPYVIFPSATRTMRIAVLPIENLSGERVPIEATLGQLRARLEEDGFRLVDPGILEEFLHRHRIRVASGLSREESRAIRDATGAEAVLITSFSAYVETPPPQISLFLRLVSSGDQPEILWMDSVGLSGEDAVRLLGIGRITETDVLLEKAVHRLTDSLARYLPAAASRAPGRPVPPLEEGPHREAPPPEPEDAVDPRILSTGDGAPPPDPDDLPGAEWEEPGLPGEVSPRYAPHTAFRSPELDPHGRYSIAVIPFVNQSERKNAGEIMALHFIDALTRVDGVRVVDPGLVREEMLRYRTVIPAGPSLATADLLSDDLSLGIDLLLSGTVFDYGGAPAPKVEFSVKILGTAAREVVWTSRSYNHGEQGVFFLDAGRVYTAHRLAEDMSRAAIRELRH